MKITVKNQEKIIEKIERAETLINELKEIFAWDLRSIEVVAEDEKPE